MDEFMQLLIQAAMKEMGNGKANPTHSTITPPNMGQLMDKAAAKSATMAKKLNDAFVKAGFDQEQAFELTVATISSRKN